MPLYEYYCLDCMKIFEIIKKLKDFDKPVKCPYCGKELKLHITAQRTRWRYNDL